MTDLTVEVGATLTIETGVQLYFDTGVGLKIKGAIQAIGNEFAHIEMLPYQQQLNYDDTLPDFRLIDGPTVRQGRLQMRFRDRWRSVCTMVTNWTSIDTSVACRSMGFADGGFHKWYLRNNESYPVALPRPNCHPGANSLWDCGGLSNLDRIKMSENLCQGEDDIGIVCWGPPIFRGWARHWKGLQIFNSPFYYVNADPDMVAVQKESASRLEFIDILYAGYDGVSKNVTSALWIEGVPPIMNGLRIERSARDGMYLYESSGPILIANSTFSFNRGHGIAVDNTTDARLFINMTRIEGNWGDGIWYKQKIGTNLLSHGIRSRRELNIYDEEQPRLDICDKHELPSNLFFPHLISAHLANKTLVDPSLPSPCWIAVFLPPRLPYTYSLQFLSVRNRNPPQTVTSLVVCDATDDHHGCALERHRIPIHDGIYPQSLSIKSSGQPMFVSLEHSLEGNNAGYVAGDVDLLFRIHASVMDKAYYGLNVTNSIIYNNTGNGIQCYDIRERTAVSNVTIGKNQGMAGFLVKSGAADIWFNETRIVDNWGDGMNVTFAGGSVMVNGTRIERNRWRGAAFHFNDTSPFLAMHMEFIFKGRPSNNIFYLPTVVAQNEWGGILVGNFCIPSIRHIEPKVLINWVEMLGNFYHPALEIHSCRGEHSARTLVDITGNRIEGNQGIGVRISPAVNMHTVISSNQFLNNNDTALLIKNSEQPWLWRLGSNITISKNSFKFNRAKYIISIGLNEDAPGQKLIFNQQNEVRENIVFNPSPHLRPRTSPYAALVVSSSNVVIHRNCFKNPQAEYEIATELAAHAKWIDARENNWGTPSVATFMRKIFDQFNRYSLASIVVDPYAAVCNQRNPHITRLQEYFREFRHDAEPFQLGGAIYENHDLPPGRYTVNDDLHVVSGAKLTVAPGSIFEFKDSVGMLVQGELLRTEFFGHTKKVIFTAAPFIQPKVSNIRLVDEDGSDQVIEGRLEVLVDDEWGTVCNRSWTATHARMACNQLGLIMDPEFFENWRTFPEKGDLPIRMDNIRCEENEVDITRCRHDGVLHNVAAGCRPTEVVGLRCFEPRWAGVRYSLLASPPAVTGQTTMNNWVIEKAGSFDFKVPEFSAALQIDWNYHTFHNLEVKNNFWNGIDVVYNDLTKKPAIRNSVITNNRRNGVHLRSAGITIEEVTVSQSGQAGFRYNPKVSSSLQQDIVSWLELREQPELEANNVFIIPNTTHSRIQVFESQLNQRKFLVAKETSDCPAVPMEMCKQEIVLESIGFEYGLASKIAVQLVNPVSNISDEDAVFYDSGNRIWSARRDSIHFPIVSNSNQLRMTYTRSYGKPRLILLIFFLDAQEYLDRFVHVYQSRVEDNQYGVSSVHYSNLSFADGTLTNRWNNEKIWFQKVNFTRNSEAVMWIHAPQHAVVPDTPIAEITYHLDNCSLVDNSGPVIETHRDLFASANVFHWNIWSNTFANNTNSGIAIRLPDIYDLRSKQQHTFWMTENRFEQNNGFRVLLDGYYVFANISSNNFTDNYARKSSGIMELSGMEKTVYMERNRFLTNWGHWMVKFDINSQYLQKVNVPAYVQYNYFLHNHFIKTSEDYVDMWPRSYAVGVFGSQHVDIHYNRLRNNLMDFELVSGCKYQDVYATMNVTFNWWGMGNEAEIAQRIFDFDDWNSYTLADYSPFYVTYEHFIDFWWDFRGRKGQLANATRVEPSVYDLKGRMFDSKNMTLIKEKWHNFPHYYKPYRPYRITRDLTIMPGATLNIERGVEVHVWPNVRILVLGDLIADGTYWEPIRFKPINTTEFDEIRGKIGTRYKRSSGVRLRNKRSNVELRINDFIRKKRANRARPDVVYKEFPILYREDPYYQKFDVLLTSNSSESERSGFLMIHNATTGEIVASCDRQFTIRNAQVVCRQLGYPTMNAYHWITPYWDYNPQIHIRKTYMEPRECRGNEPSFDKCNLRLTGNDSQWMCMDNEHFNYIYCGLNVSLNSDYIGNWGGITFGRGNLELNSGTHKDSSILRNVEVVGGGSGHNDSWQSAGLQIFYRSPVLDHVNVTNSSMHAVQIVSPQEKVILNHMNVTHNRGQGIAIVTANLQVPNANADAPISPLNIPYNAQGILDMCSAVKNRTVLNRILVYYKYDSMPVDCVKIFTSPGRKLSFRFLQVNLYSNPVDLGRADALRVYSSDSFLPSTLLAEYRTDIEATPFSQSVSAETVSLHLRATASDGNYGFLAEISATPSSPDSHPIDEVVIRASRIDHNDRGAIDYQNSGEMSPNVIIESCSISYNGINLFGNVSTTHQAVQLQLHNTMVLLFRGNSLAHNRGGLLVSAKSSSAVARLTAIIKNNLFSWNSNSTTIAFVGNNYQMVTMINNVVSMNYALYHDTVLVHDMSLNMTKNVFSYNTGLHTVDTHGYSRITSETQVFLYNNFDDNLALGHGHQYKEAFGYQPLEDHDEFLRRPKRQVLSQQGISYDWWTHVGTETERYRSTILAGTANQQYKGNVFNNPRNSYELAAARQTQYDMGTVNARQNYWGYPGTDGVAAGKIVDHSDYPYLLRVDYQPVLETNTSLVQGNCPAGWFTGGHTEFQSCYLFVGGAATYSRAVAYCEELGAFVPYLRAEDARQKALANRLDEMATQFVTDQERFSSFEMPSDTHVWISSAHIPPSHCGWLSARNGKVGSVNCNSLLPFLCERGIQTYDDPIMWRSGTIIALVIVAILFALVFLFGLCWCVKSHRRKEETIERKKIIRASIKLQRKAQQESKRWGLAGAPSHHSAMGSVHGSTINAYGDSFGASRTNARSGTTRSPTETERTSCSATSTERTYEKTYMDTSRADQSATSYTRGSSASRTTDETYTVRSGDYSDSTYYSTRTPRRSRVNQNPNPYAEIPTMHTFQSPNRKSMRPVSMSEIRLRDGSSLSSPRSSATPCSTCPTDSERDSTLTGDSWPERTVAIPESTV
ncbi:unnamed protein product [Auanema sp. JU1783]|nr:unnamed protein product [Auanema sp. JU1783]